MHCVDFTPAGLGVLFFVLLSWPVAGFTRKPTNYRATPLGGEKSPEPKHLIIWVIFDHLRRGDLQTVDSLLVVNYTPDHGQNGMAFGVIFSCISRHLRASPRSVDPPWQPAFDRPGPSSRRGRGLLATRPLSLGNRGLRYGQALAGTIPQVSQPRRNAA